MSWEAHARTDTGRVRDRNEDGFLADDSHGLFAVADGMGGRMGGDVASEIFVETLDNAAASLAESLAGGDPIDDPDHRTHVLRQLNTVFLEANRQIFNTGRGEMGTTGDAVLIGRDVAFVAHVGDSRTYLLRDGELNRLTTDHTYAESGADRDQPALSEEEFEHVLTRSLGTHPHVSVDTVFVELEPGDDFLLCTDGLTKQLDEPEIEQLADEHPPEELVDLLIERSRSVGGVDNTTALVARVPDQPSGEFGERDSIETTRKLELLQRLGLFQGLESRTILQLLRHVFTVDFERGEELIARGADGGALYVVVTGSVEVRRDGHTLAEFEPGQHVGEMALVDQGPRSADVVAAEKVRALKISRKNFQEMVVSDPEIGNTILQNLLRNCVERLRETTEQLLFDRTDDSE